MKDLGDGSSGVSGQPMLSNIELLDFNVGCGEDGIVVRSIEGECKILPSRTTPPSSATPSLAPSIAPSELTTQQVHPTSLPSDGPANFISPTYPPTSPSSYAPSTFKVQSESLDPSSSTSIDPSLSPSAATMTPSVITQSSVLPTSDEPSHEPSAASSDCTTQFCEKKLSDEYLLRYMINVEDATITMEAIYDGEAWVAIAFSEDENMPGSDAVM